MAPFIPQGLINPELNLFFALIIGFGFGYVLEQAGFSSAKKLAGVFYGYDFVVLRVFFTAGITALTGLIFFEYLGWIDMGLVYINPTYLWSAIIGGVIMGFGFIMGGFCPGTSIVAAVIGKIDAIVFIVGIFIGIFLFGHFYNAFENIYYGEYLGQIFIYDSLGISKKWFVFFLAVMALGAFVFTKIIEDKVNKVDINQLNKRVNYTLPAFLLFFLVSLYLFLPEERRSSIREKAPEEIMANYQSEKFYISPVEAAYKIINNANDFVLVDVRDSLSVSLFTLPTAIHIPLENIFNRQYRQFFRDDELKKVFYSNGEAKAVKAWALASRAGYDNVFVLKGGLNGFFDLFFSDKFELNEGNLMDEFNSRFISNARQYFMKMKKPEQPKQSTPVRKMIEIVVPDDRVGC